MSSSRRRDLLKMEIVLGGADMTEKGREPTQVPIHLRGLERDFESQDSAGFFPDAKSTEAYRAPERNDYHKDRLRAMRILANSVNGANGLRGGLTVVDFGIGDGVELSELGIPLKHVIGIDTSAHMLELARKSLASIDATFFLGNAGALQQIPDNSTDLVLATNVLGYLDPIEEKLFWSEAKRILRQGGHVLVTLGNQLFDLFALNSGTSEFFEKEFDIRNAEKLLTHSATPRFLSARRHNPLALRSILEAQGMPVVAEAYSQWHHTPPITLQLQGLTLREARAKSRDHSFDPNDLEPGQIWRALFQCSLIAMLFKKS